MVPAHPRRLTKSPRNFRANRKLSILGNICAYSACFLDILWEKNKHYSHLTIGNRERLQNINNSEKY